jgi:hypothetical protein
MFVCLTVCWTVNIVISHHISKLKMILNRHLLDCCLVLTEYKLLFFLKYEYFVTSLLING